MNLHTLLKNLSGVPSLTTDVFRTNLSMGESCSIINAKRDAHRTTDAGLRRCRLSCTWSTMYHLRLNDVMTTDGTVMKATVRPNHVQCLPRNVTLTFRGKTRAPPVVGKRPLWVHRKLVWLVHV